MKLYYIYLKVDYWIVLFISYYLANEEILYSKILNDPNLPHGWFIIYDIFDLSDIVSAICCFININVKDPMRSREFTG